MWIEYIECSLSLCELVLPSCGDFFITGTSLYIFILEYVTSKMSTAALHVRGTALYAI